MATVNNRKIVDDLIKNKGFYEDDPQAYMIVEYENAAGHLNWGITWTNESPERRTRYLEQTEFINNPKVIWHKDGL